MGGVVVVNRNNIVVLNNKNDLFPVGGWGVSEWSSLIVDVGL